MPKKKHEAQLEAIIKDRRSREERLADLVDAAYLIVELCYEDQTAQQTAWKKDWLKKARELVPGCEVM